MGWLLRLRQLVCARLEQRETEYRRQLLRLRSRLSTTASRERWRHPKISRCRGTAGQGTERHSPAEAQCCPASICRCRSSLTAAKVSAYQNFPPGFCIIAAQNGDSRKRIEGGRQ